MPSAFPKRPVYVLIVLCALVAAQALFDAPAAQKATLVVHNNTGATIEVHAYNKYYTSNFSSKVSIAPESIGSLKVHMGQSIVVFRATRTGDAQVREHRREYNFHHSGRHEIEIFAKDFGATALFDRPELDRPDSSSVNECGVAGSTPNANGKYCESSGSYSCPNDGDYAPYTDYGYWAGGEDCGQKNLPAGYYVYCKNTWHHYKKLCGADQSQAPETVQSTPSTKNANGKYCSLISSYSCPGDTQYAPYTDFGHWAGGNDCGQTNLPAGYYVYDQDTWYIYANICAGK